MDSVISCNLVTKTFKPSNKREENNILIITHEIEYQKLLDSIILSLNNMKINTREMSNIVPFVTSKDNGVYCFKTQ